MKKIIHIILKKKLYKFTKNKCNSTFLEESIKDSNNLLKLKTIFTNYLLWLIDIHLNETINFITKNKSLLKYLNIYINQNNPTGNILIINNTKELTINTTLFLSLYYKLKNKKYYEHNKNTIKRIILRNN